MCFKNVDFKMTEIPIVLFTLDEQPYALTCESVKRIIQVVDIVSVPNVSNNILGAINVEGNILTVMNIRHQLGLSEKEIALSDFIIICSLKSGSIGFIVDTIDFITIKGEQKETIGEVDILKLSSGLTYMLDIEKLFEAKEGEIVKAIQHLATEKLLTQRS